MLKGLSTNCFGNLGNTTFSKQCLPWGGVTFGYVVRSSNIHECYQPELSDAVRDVIVWPTMDALGISCHRAFLYDAVAHRHCCLGQLSWFFSTG